MSEPMPGDPLTPKMADMLAAQRELDALHHRFPKLIGGALAYALGRLTDEELELLRDVLMTTRDWSTFRRDILDGKP